jgi:metal-responsive CopG/Arc/MetJ family transcriptional regulator
MKKKICITMDSELLEVVEELRKTEGRNRSEVIEAGVKLGVSCYVSFLKKLMDQRKGVRA